MFKALRYLLFGALSGALAVSMLLREKPRRSRTIYEMSPLRKEAYEGGRTLYDIDENEYAQYLSQLLDELIQPGMTELEVERVRNEVYEVMSSIAAYKGMREIRKVRERDSRSKRWTDQIEDDL